MGSENRGQTSHDTPRHAVDRPDGRPQGFQRWSNLLFLHWAVPADELRSMIPSSLQLDLFDGVAYVGLVPFVMQDIRPRWWPAGWGLNFLETNVRTYVIHEGRAGVFFFSLDANSRLAVWTARRFWSLPYYHAAMTIVRSSDRIQYQSLRSPNGAGVTVDYRLGEWLGPSKEGTVEYFLLERYLLFVERHNEVLRGRVHHVPYPAQCATVNRLDQTLLGACGLKNPDRPPEFVHFAEHVDVEVFPLKS